MADCLQTPKMFDKNQNEIILESLSEGVCRVDLEGRIVYANPSAERMLGFNGSEMIGQHYAEVFFARNRETFLEETDFCPIGFVLREGEISHVNTEKFFQRDGETAFSVEYICVPLKENGEITGAVVSFQDVTERRDVEQTITDARDAALEAARAKAAFLANMSHEIRTPLSGIIGTADLLLDSNLTEEQRRYTEILKQSTDLLANIVNDILDFSKIEAGKFEREKTEFDVRQTAHETLEFFSTLTRRKDLRLQLEVNRSIPEILFGDANSVRQILNNFLSNAVKFTDSGKIILKIALVERGEKNVRLKFSVADTGIGIDEQARRKLFQPFTQADSSTTRKFGGTGLGLAISKQLAEMMPAGRIGVESEPGRGSVFWFEGGFEIAEAGKDSSRSKAEVSKTTNSNGNKVFIGDRADLKILIVEDSLTNREITAEMLKQIGFDSDTAENGREALEICRKKKFDLILMDCQMPEMDGFEATRLIREAESLTGNPKIIAFTASVTAKEKDRCLEAGMNDYLSKPFTKHSLEEMLEKHFEIHNLPLNLDLQENLIHHSLSKIIEPKMLESLLEIEENNQPGFVFEILDVFLDHAEVKFLETETALAVRDRKKIRETSHNLKGSSANVGLTDLSKLFEELEKRARETDWAEVESLFEEARKIFFETKKIILEIKP